MPFGMGSVIPTTSSPDTDKLNIIEVGNSLPTGVVEADSVTRFTKGTDRFWEKGASAVIVHGSEGHGL